MMVEWGHLPVCWVVPLNLKEKRAMALYTWIQEQYNLEPEEAAVVEWQYGYCGDFRRALWKAIAKADKQNLARLRSGFPVEIRGFEKYSREFGWWQGVLKKMGWNQKGKL